MTLSYEKALRMHRRYRSSTEQDSEISANASSAAALNESQPGDRAGNDLKSKKSGTKSTGTAPERDPAAAAKRDKATAQPSQAPHLPKSALKASSTPVGMPLTMSSPPGLKDRKTQSAPEVFLNSDDPHDTGRLNEGNTGRPPRHDLQVACRRSTVSVRLSETEVARLKDRADAAGVSVSAYIRSCVLDAEILRAQVKQALAQMRSSGAVLHANHLPAIPAPALPAENSSHAANGGSWLHSLLRSAAACVGPVFLFRRGA